MATYYWVGGNGTWDDSSKTNWATVSGGAGGNGPPTNADTVNFDANSGTAATVTVAATAVSLSTTINKSDINLSLSGSPTLCTSAGILTLTAGTLTLNTYTLTAGTLSSNNSNARTIAFGTGNLTLTGNGGFVVFMSTQTNLTVTGTPTVNLTYSGGTGTRTINAGQSAGGNEARSFNYNISAGTDTISFTGGGNVKSLSFSGFSGTWNNTILFVYGNLTLSSGMTVNAGTNTVYLASASSAQSLTTAGKTMDFPVSFGYLGTETCTITLQDACTIGSTRTLSFVSGTLTLNGNNLSTGVFGSNYTTTRALNFGSNKIIVTGNATTVINIGGTNFSYTGTPLFDCAYSGSTGTRTISHITSVTQANAIDVSISAGTDTVNLSTSGIRNLDFTGFAGTYSNTAITTYGNVTFSTGMTLSAGTSAMTFAATSGTQQITSNGKTLDFPVTFNGIGGTFACQDALTLGSTRTLTLTNGTLQLKNGVTSTVGTFATSGTNQKVLQSTTPGAQATLSDAAGTLNLTYLTVRDIAATGGARFNALNNCITQGNNSGWYFAPQLGRPHLSFAF